MRESKQLFRGSKDVVLGGVCSGIADFINTDVTVIRIVFVLIALFWGSGLLLYILLWIFMPIAPLDYEFGQTFNKMHDNMDNLEQDDFMKNYQKHQIKKKHNANFIGGIILITVGILFLISEYIPRIDFSDLWPIILIVIGALLLRNNYQSRNKEGQNPDSTF